MSRICRLRFVITTFIVGPGWAASEALGSGWKPTTDWLSFWNKHYPIGVSPPYIFVFSALSAIVGASSWMRSYNLGPGRYLSRLTPSAIGWGLPTAQRLTTQEHPKQSQIRTYRERAESVKMQTPPHTSSGTSRGILFVLFYTMFFFLRKILLIVPLRRR